MANDAQIAKRQASRDAQKAKNDAQFERFNKALARGGDERAAAHLSKSGNRVVTVQVGPHQRTFINEIPQDIQNQIIQGNPNFSVVRSTEPGDFPGEVKKSAPDFGRKSSANPRGAETTKDRLFRERRERDESRINSQKNTFENFQNNESLESITGQGQKTIDENTPIAETPLVSSPTPGKFGSLVNPTGKPVGFQTTQEPTGFRTAENRIIGKPVVPSSSDIVPTGFRSAQQATPTREIRPSIPTLAPTGFRPATSSLISPQNLSTPTSRVPSNNPNFIGPIQQPKDVLITVGRTSNQNQLSPISAGLRNSFNRLDAIQVQTGPQTLANQGITPQNKPLEFLGRTTVNTIIGAPVEVGKSVLATGIAIRNFGTQVVQPRLTGKPPKEPAITVQGTTVADAVIPVTINNGNIAPRSAQNIAKETSSFITTRGPSAFISGFTFDFVLPGAQAVQVGRQAVQKGAPVVSKLLTSRSSGVKIGDSVSTNVRQTTQGRTSLTKTFAEQPKHKPATRANEIDTSADDAIFGFEKTTISLGKGTSNSQQFRTRFTPKQQKPVELDPSFKPATRANEIDFTDSARAQFSNTRVKLGSGIGNQKSTIPKVSPFISTKVNLGPGIGKNVPRNGKTKGFGGSAFGGGGFTGGKTTSKGFKDVTPKGSKEIRTNTGQVLLTRQKPVTKSVTFKQFPVQLGKSKGSLVTKQKPPKVAQVLKTQTKTKKKPKSNVAQSTGLTSIVSTTQATKQTTKLTSKVIAGLKSGPKQLTTTKTKKKQQVTNIPVLTTAQTFKTTSGQKTTTLTSFTTPTLTKTSTIFARPQGTPTQFPTQITDIPPIPPRVVPPLFPPSRGGNDRRPRRGGRRKNTKLKIHAVFNPLGGSFSIAEGTKGVRIL